MEFEKCARENVSNQFIGLSQPEVKQGRCAALTFQVYSPVAANRKQVQQKSGFKFRSLQDGRIKILVATLALKDEAVKVGRFGRWAALITGHATTMILNQGKCWSHLMKARNTGQKLEATRVDKNRVLGIEPDNLWRGAEARQKLREWVRARGMFKQRGRAWVPEAAVEKESVMSGKT